MNPVAAPNDARIPREAAEPSFGRGIAFGIFLIDRQDCQAGIDIGQKFISGGW